MTNRKQAAGILGEAIGSAAMRRPYSRWSMTYHEHLDAFQVEVETINEDGDDEPIAHHCQYIGIVSIENSTFPEIVAHKMVSWMEECMVDIFAAPEDDRRETREDK